MQRLLVILVLSIVLVVASCQNTSKDNGYLNEFDIPGAINNPEQIKLSDFVSEISYVELETKQESLIGNIQKIIPVDDYYIVSTRESQLKLFSKNGDFISDIGKTGKGPGEYQSIGDIFWDENAKEIIVQSIESNSLVFYSINGDHLKTFENPYYLQFINRLSNGSYLGAVLFPTLMDSVFATYVLFDTDGMVKPLWASKDKPNIDRPSLFMKHYFCQMGGLDLFFPPRSDTVYVIENNKVKPFASMNLHDKVLPDDAYFSQDRKKDIWDRSFISYGSVGISKNEFLVTYKIEKKVFIVICNTSTGKAKAIEMGENGIPNDIDGGIPILGFSYLSQYKNFMVQGVSPINLKSGIEEGYFKNVSSEFKEMVSNLDEEANPLIIEMKLK